MLARGRSDDDRKKRLLERCLKHLRELFLVKDDPRPRTMDELLNETYNRDAYPTLKQWVEISGLPGLDRVEMTEDGKFVYEPPLPCRDAASLWALLKEYKKNHKGMLREEVLDSIPGEDKAVDAINSLRDKVSFLGTEERLQVLIVKDMPSKNIPEVKPIWRELWRSVDLSQIDKRHIEAQLEQDGVKVEQKKFKPPGKGLMRPRRVKQTVAGEDGTSHVRHIKCNSHVMQDLKDYISRGKDGPGGN